MSMEEWMRGTMRLDDRSGHTSSRSRSSTRALSLASRARTGCCSPQKLSTLLTQIDSWTAKKAKWTTSSGEGAPSPAVTLDWLRLGPHHLEWRVSAHRDRYSNLSGANHPTAPRSPRATRAPRRFARSDQIRAVRGRAPAPAPPPGPPCAAPPTLEAPPRVVAPARRAPAGAEPVRRA